MRNKIQNQLLITCLDVDLTTVANIEFYVRQAGWFRKYQPNVIDSDQMVVIIPFEDARNLVPGKVKLQFAFTDAEGNPRATEVEEIPVDELLKEAGYDPL